MNAFIFNPIRKEDEKQFVFTWNRQKYAYAVLPQGCVNPWPSIIISPKGHGLPGHSAEHHMGPLYQRHNINWTRGTKAASIFNFLVSHICSRKWDKCYLSRFRGQSYQYSFRHQWGMQEQPPESKRGIIASCISHHCEGNIIYVRPLCIQETVYSTQGKLLQPI